MPRLRTIALLFAFLMGAISIGCNRSSVEQQVASERLEGTAFTIKISSDGIYAVDLNKLKWHNRDPESGQAYVFSLKQGEKSVPYYLNGNLLVFFGIGPDSRYAKQRHYVLEAGVPGILMESKTLGEGPLSRSTEIWHSRRYEENYIYDGASVVSLPRTDRETDPWFWKTIQVAVGTDIEFDLPEVQISQAILSLALWGVSENPRLEPDHIVEVSINNQNIGEAEWDGQEYYTGSIEFDPILLLPGRNMLSLSNRDGGTAAIDISRVDWFEIDYRSAPIPDNDRLLLPAVSGEFALTGFTEKPSIFDITDKQKPVLLTGWDYADEILSLPVDEPLDLLVVGPEGYQEPNEIEPLVISDLRSQENQADMLIIANAILHESLRPLVEVRNSQSLSVRQVTLDEIYGAFGDGQNGPDGIREFIEYALSHWSEPYPRYLLLVGDASYDYRGYLGDDIENLIPAPMVPVQFSGETVSDNRLVDIDGDSQPDMAVGRWPVTKPAEVTSLVNRTLAYEQRRASEQVLFVADGSSAEFTNLNQAVLEMSGFNLGELNLTAGGDIIELLQAWNEGAWLVNYAGHGSLDRWGKEGLLVNEQIGEFSDIPTSPPIVVQLTCLTGYFAHPSLKSLSESLLQSENGPVIVIGASSLTLSEDQQPFGANLLSQLNDVEVLRIGDAFLQAKIDLDLASNPGLKEVSDTFNLLGDPATIIVRPE